MPTSPLNNPRLHGVQREKTNVPVKYCQAEATPPPPPSYLSVPNGIGGVADDSGPSLLAVVGTRRETALLPWLNGHLKIRVRIEEHPFLEPNCPEIFKERERGEERREGEREEGR